MKALTISNLQKTYDNGHEALKGISLDVAEGDFFALLGPNGAGKSTTLGIVCSLVRKSAGKVSIFGVDIDQDFALAKQLIGVVPQEFNFSVFEKVEDIVLTAAGYQGLTQAQARPRTEQLLRDLGLWEKRKQQARMLSGGMKRRLMIARALVHNPKLLILDEPTAGVDIELRRSMWSFMQEINRQGTTIILTTHYLEEAENLCRNIAIIDKGEIVKNTSMKALLSELNSETFVLDLTQPVQAAPQLDAFVSRLKDDHTLEVEVRKGQSISQVFSALQQQGIEVLSLRNKANRLEELFVSLVEKTAASDFKADQPTAKVST
ncbi:ABC transporter ATP-binding protein [Marinospirillum alkaliphilum]|uniref:ABC-2 type transport system ATP-binding protein n=1 Tax=Marinospirillum alkaliphilum DSM 21637 TaxID=1122209 RepID=A0A1K1TM53_9GAMM|nr:ABC transporter ATP-binding protein [Marinospirillum alkaliphilum]SFX01809.1 ABC-2 type transport system ATP-binding protein [Marinospirillum alkaliphilum DSM 21637]